jgi:ABC-type sugar transport system ATPase subunit
VRPEDIIVRDVSIATRNAVEVMVTTMEFLGFFFRARLVVSGAIDLAFDANFSTNLVRDVNIQVGRSMTVAFNEERLHVFKGL